MLDEAGEPLVPPRPRALQRLGEDERLAGWPLPPGGPNQVSPPPPGPSSPPPSGLDRGWYVPHVSWVLVWPATRVPCPNTARSESKLPAQCVCARGCARAGVREGERASEHGAEGRPTASHFQYCTEEGKRDSLEKHTSPKNLSRRPSHRLQDRNLQIETEETDSY